MRNFFCICTLIALLCGVSFAEDVDSSAYTNSQKEGWWWGKYVEPEEKKDEEQKKDEVQKATQPVSPSAQSWPTMAELKNLPPKEIGKLLDRARDLAVQYPNEENVTRYYDIQDVARRKSMAFMNTSMYVWQKHPELNSQTDYPLTLPGRNAMTRDTVEEVQSEIQAAQNDFALIYFYADGCPYCVAQDDILNFFIRQYGWPIQKVAITANPKLAAMLGVDKTPSLVLIKNGSQDFIPVSSGVVAMSELEDKVYKGIRLMTGKITPEEFSTYDREKGGPFDVNASVDHGKANEK